VILPPTKLALKEFNKYYEKEVINKIYADHRMLIDNYVLK